MDTYIKVENCLTKTNLFFSYCCGSFPLYHYIRERYPRYLKDWKVPVNDIDFFINPYPTKKKEMSPFIKKELERYLPKDKIEEAQKELKRKIKEDYFKRTQEKIDILIENCLEAGFTLLKRNTRILELVDVNEVKVQFIILNDNEKSEFLKSFDLDICKCIMYASNLGCRSHSICIRRESGIIRKNYRGEEINMDIYVSAEDDKIEEAIRTRKATLLLSETSYFVNERLEKYRNRGFEIKVVEDKKYFNYFAQPFMKAYQDSLLEFVQDQDETDLAK